MDITPCLLLFLLLIHGLVLQTSYAIASRKLPIMAEARDIHYMDTMESKSIKLLAQMKVDFRKNKGKPIRGRPSSPIPNRPVHMFLPPAPPPPRVLLRRSPPPPCHS
ncbi:hypothetical protein CCACVL1_17971 [Corchorus capsularis]|uniref:Transmembrane protein n=1 Tax=Corchorus capsularis TaxID=210143 RepID=A0A1R3HP58_COCAP|nr:hypothetical protein CCACVL1_17971 [Corchorus capsularis]